MGNRIAKHIELLDGTRLSSTYYILDAQGNPLAMYELDYAASSFELTERQIYGSARLGSLKTKVDVFGSAYEDYNDVITAHAIGDRNYELSNHLGNVLTVVSDKLIPKFESSAPTIVSGYTADLVMSCDYSPFGVTLEGRGVEGSYRFGFNGQEKDDEVSGSGNSYTAEFWQYDSRLGRRWNIDPVVKSWESSYATFTNNPIFFIDPKGDNAGDFYNKDGEYLGSDGIVDDKVYVADNVTKNDKGLVVGSTNSQELNMSHSEFQKTANIVKHESSGNKTESLWIAHAANNAKEIKDVGGIHTNIYQQLISPGYSSVSSSVKTTPLETSDNSSIANNARAGVINVLMGGADPTDGAVFWDGTDFLTKGVKHNKFKEAVSITIIGSHFSDYQEGVRKYNSNLDTHSSFSKNNIYLPKNATDGPCYIPAINKTFRNDYGWMGGNFFSEGKGKYYHYSTTGGQGASLFWKITPK